MSKWRNFVARVMGLAAMVEAQKTDGILVAARLPRVAETPKPRPAGMATEFQRNIKPPKKGKGTRKQRKEESMRWRRREVALGCFFKEAISAADVAAKQGLISEGYKEVFVRYGSKAHRRALAKLTQ